MQPVTYDQAYNNLGSVYDPQTQLLSQQSAQLDTDAQTQQASLDQAKVNAFKDIDTSANRKGILFSGFSPDQQAQYIGTKYLPAVANLKSSTLNAKQTLASKIAELQGQRSQDATNQVNAYQKDSEDQAYKQAQLNLSYARLGNSQAAAANKPLTQTQVISAIRSNLESVKGGDNHVAPQDLAQAYKDFTQSGYNPNDFWKYFQGYWNPNQSTYKAIYNQALGG